jgi:hypothetical protein
MMVTNALFLIGFSLEVFYGESNSTGREFEGEFRMIETSDRYLAAARSNTCRHALAFLCLTSQMYYHCQTEGIPSNVSRPIGTFAP